MVSFHSVSIYQRLLFARLKVCGCGLFAKKVFLCKCLHRRLNHGKGGFTQNPVTAYKPAYGKRLSSHMQQEHHHRQPR